MPQPQRRFLVLFGFLLVACDGGGGGNADGGMDVPVVDRDATEDGAAIDTATVDGSATDSVVGGTLKAFPSAFGAGANTTGGRGGRVVQVTTLAARGVFAKHCCRPRAERWSSAWPG